MVLGITWHLLKRRAATKRPSLTWLNIMYKQQKLSARLVQKYSLFLVVKSHNTLRPFSHSWKVSEWCNEPWTKKEPIKYPNQLRTSTSSSSHYCIRTALLIWHDWAKAYLRIKFPETLLAALQGDHFETSITDDGA